MTTRSIFFKGGLYYNSMRHSRLTTLAMAAAMALAACGGGGGDAAAVSTGSDTPAETPQGVPVVSIDALPTDTQALHIEVDERMATPDYLSGLLGGGSVAAWNLRDPRLAMAPGMKVAFFGNAPECAGDAANGPVVAGSDTEFATAQSLTGIANGAVTAQTRWTPSGAMASCNLDAQGKTGPNWIFVNPMAAGGGIGMLTQTGPDLTGKQPFLTTTSPAGIDGDGYNANGLANFVAFREAWNSADAIRPWRVAAGQASGEARVVSRQSMGSAVVGINDGTTVQVKQQTMVSLINTACQKGVERPCQIQYLFNTSAVRAGVTDWEAQSPSGQGRVWFDVAQAGLPIVAGLVPAKGGQVIDPDSGLALYRSEGAATQHQSFSDQPFDLRIRFAELMNAARIVAARQLSVRPQDVTDAQMAQRWTAQWNDPEAWTLVSSTFGHEIYNAASTSRHAHIGGGFSNLYVGPTR